MLADSAPPDPVGPVVAGPGHAWPDPADALLQPGSPAVPPPLCQTALQLSATDNSKGIAACSGGDVTPAAQLQSADSAALQQKPALVSQLQRPGSASQMQDSGKTSQLQP